MAHRRAICLVPNPSAAYTPSLRALPNGTSEIDLTVLPGARGDIKSYRFDAAPTANGPWSTLAVQSFPMLAHNGLAPSQTVFYRCQVVFQSNRISNFSGVISAATKGSLSANAAAAAFASGTLNPSTGGTQMRLINGSLVWGDNPYLSGVQGTVIRSNFPAIRTNKLMKGVYVSMTLGDITTTVPGDLSKGFALMDALIGPGGLASTADHPMAFMFEIWHSIFNKQTMNTVDFPQYWINNGWLKVVASSSATNPTYRVVPDWNNDAVWTDLTNICIKICQRYNGNQYFGGFSPMDESDAVSVDSVSGQTILNSSHYNQKLLQLFLDIKAQLPNAPVHAAFNYLPPGDSTIPSVMANMITTLEARFPRGFIYGGPDPFVRQTTFQKLVAGLLQAQSGMGDIRRNILLINRVQEVFLGNNGNPPTNPGVTPLQIYDTGVVNNSVVFTWNWETWEYYKWADQLAAITARNGVVGTPPPGNYTII